MTFDCQTCGACCADNHREYPIPCTRADVQQMPAHVVDMLVEPCDSHRKRVRLDIVADIPAAADRNQCVFLGGVVGSIVTCTIYDVRPSICRRFVPGSDLCLEARQREGVS